MIRIETDEGWILIPHPEHARVAAVFAAHWGNAEFAPPEPRRDILTAVARHDDAWRVRDAEPFLTSQGRPSAFGRELVGKYSAFEEIDLADYLELRGRAAEMVASDNTYAAAVISMHTIDLLTTRADLSALAPADRELHARFITARTQRQEEWLASLETDPGLIQRAFEFLQACDSLSLSVCVRYPLPVPLRHAHPRRDGDRVTLTLTPLGGDTYRLSPSPVDIDELVLDIHCRRMTGKVFPDLAAFRAAYAAAPVEILKVRIVR
jgi:Protein of unknown function (DUF3891)